MEAGFFGALDVLLLAPAGLGDENGVLKFGALAHLLA